MITNKTTAIFTITIMLFVLAASFIPFTKIPVTIHVIKNAGKLKAVYGGMMFKLGVNNKHDEYKQMA